MKKSMNRREFLKYFGIGIIGGGVFLLSPLPGNIKSPRNNELQTQANETGDNSKLCELRKLIAKLQNDIKQDKIMYSRGSRAGQDVGYIAAGLRGKQREFRHYQIAYSELLGRKRNEIESPHNHNQPDELLISRIRRQFS